MKKSIQLFSIIIISSFIIVGVVSAATTISTDITTGGVLTVTGTATSSLVGVFSIGSTTPASNTLFQIGTSTSIFFIDNSNSYVGIGTTTPNNLLSVYDLIDFNNTDLNTKIGYQAGKYLVSGATWNTFLGYRAGLSSSTASTNAALYNTGIGYQALSSNTTGLSNTAIGYNSLRDNTTGIRNTSVGSNSLSANTTGSNNVVIGRGAGSSNTTGSSNTGLGHQSLNANTTGSFNSGVGDGANQRTTTGSFNTALGGQALALGTTGNNNTVVGYQAGFGITTASSSIIIGANVNAPSATTDGQLNIGNLIYGTGLYNGNTVSSAPVSGGSIGIGIATPTSLFQIASSTSNATTSVEIGRTGQTKGSCLVLYDSAGPAVYAYVATGATTFTLSATSCK